MSGIVQVGYKSEATWTSEDPFLRAGQLAVSSDTTPPKVKVGDGVTRWVDLDYINEGGGSGGGIAASFESVNKNLQQWDYAISYNVDDSVDEITYTSGLNTIVKTFGYTGDKITTITLSGDTPAGIDLIKTLTYTGDKLTSIAYT
jgi:hypothetical protein